MNRLRELNSDIEELDVLRDEARDQLVLRARVVGVDEWLWGRSLSDGTLRYIALALMLADTQERGVLCLEEPENGIHPSRIPDLVNLLYDYAVDPDEEVGEDNSLRQVIVNTHSPQVARQLNSADVVFVERARTADGSAVSAFRPIDGSWRTEADRDEAERAIPQSQQALADFIGGSPVRGLSPQLALEFGTAT